MKCPTIFDNGEICGTVMSDEKAESARWPDRAWYGMCSRCSDLVWTFMYSDSPDDADVLVLPFDRVDFDVGEPLQQDGFFARKFIYYSVHCFDADCTECIECECSCHN